MYSKSNFNYRSEAPFDPPARPLVEIVSLRLQGSLYRPELRAAAQAWRLFAATMKWLLFTLNAFWLTVSDSFILLGFSLCEGVVPSLTIERSQLLQRARPGRGMASIRMEAAGKRKVRHSTC